MEAREQGEVMVTQELAKSMWVDIVDNIKISDHKSVLQEYLDKHNLSTLPLPEWSDQIDMAYFYLQSRRNGQLVWDKTKARATYDAVIRLIEKNALFAPPVVEAEDRSVNEQLPKLEANEPSSELYKCEYKFKNNRMCKKEYRTVGHYIAHKKKHGGQR